MQEKYTIGLVAAVLININIIIGAGLFINPRPLTYLAGRWGFASYIVGGLVIFPLILTLAKLTEKHPKAGGLYVFSGKNISPLIGFVSCWGYFLGKTTSAGLLAYTFVGFTQSIIPMLSALPTLPLAIATLYALALANIAGVFIGGAVQYLFVSLKIVPIGFVVLAGMYSFIVPPPAAEMMHHSVSFLTTLPIAIFALLGFEVTCSIAHLVRNPKKNASRAIIISSVLVVGLAALFQFFMYHVLGDQLTTAAMPIYAYIHAFFATQPWLASALNAAVFISILGGSFGMLTSNCWNLYTLAENNHLPFKKFLTSRTEGNVPWGSLLTQATLSSLILSISIRQVALQNMAVFGMFIAYLLSCLAAYKVFCTKRTKTISPLLPGTAIAGCLGIMSLSIVKIMASGISYSFLILLVIGIGIASYRHYASRIAVKPT